MLTAKSVAVNRRAGCAEDRGACRRPYRCRSRDDAVTGRMDARGERGD
jgi:hypothetical protein